MTENPNFESLIKKDFNLGTIYLDKKFVITNFNEGVDIDYRSFEDVGNYIKSFYNGKEFGYIANRKNSYSINLKDASFFNDAFPNIKAYAIVAHNTFTERIFEIENHFFPQNRKAFKTMNEAIDWVESVLG